CLTGSGQKVAKWTDRKRFTSAGLTSRGKTFSCHYVPELDVRVEAGNRQPLVVGVEGNRENPTQVGLKAEIDRPRPFARACAAHVAHQHCALLRSGGKPLAVRA